MKAWWAVSPKPGNAGDIFTPWMMRRDGVEPEFVNPNVSGKILGIGSTLKYAQPGDQVWTTGLMRRSDRPSLQAKFRAVRGPISADACGLGSRVPLGDGALCLPRYYAPKTHPVHKLGVVPHYVDAPHKSGWPVAWLDALVINTLTTDVEDFIDQICSCERIESSSLHGGIVAAAYGIPFKFVKLGNRLCGDGTKFEDAIQGIAAANVDDLMEARPWLK